LSKGRADAQDSCDKAIMSVAGGGLAVALGFVRPVSSPVWPSLLLAACGLFAFSLLGVVQSFRTSAKSFAKAMDQVDSQVDEDRISERG
jgi:hypothetical protein